MAAYLFSWDPTKWDWRSIKEQSDQVGKGVPVARQWACGSNRRIFNGDIAYFIRQGREPRGIFARGEVTRGSYEAANVDVQDAARGRNTLVVDLRFTHLENATKAVVINRAALKGGSLGKFVWDIRESGTRIPDAVAAELESAWQKATGAAPDKKAAEAAANRAAVEANAAGGKKPAARPDAADAPAAEKPKPAASPVDAAEQERLKHEREERLRKIKERELEQRRNRAGGGQDAAPGPAPLSPEKRNEVLVQNYFIMLDAELQGELYSKADHRNRILKELGEADGELVDRTHRQISGVLAGIGLPFSESFAPQGGFDDGLETAVQTFIEANPELVEALWIDQVPPASSIPVELDDAKSYWVATPEASTFRPDARPEWHPGGLNEIDYRVRESHNRNLATAGERFVLAFERARLREAGMKDAIEQISWQSQTFGDSFGYDIHSLEEDGGDRFICVKTTNYGNRFPFVLSSRELDRAKEHPGNYYIYRVYRFSRGAKLFILPASELSPKRLEPVVYRAWT